MRFLVVLKGTTRTIGIRHSTRPADLYLSAISFAPGDGYKVNKIHFTTNPARAQLLSKLAAIEVMKEMVGPRWRKLEARVEDETGHIVETARYTRPVPTPLEAQEQYG